MVQVWFGEFTRAHVALVYLLLISTSYLSYKECIRHAENREKCRSITFNLLRADKTWWWWWMLWCLHLKFWCHYVVMSILYDVVYQFDIIIFIMMSLHSEIIAMTSLCYIVMSLFYVVISLYYGYIITLCCDAITIC